MDMIFKTLRVKATTVSVRLRIYLCALKIPTGPPGEDKGSCWAVTIVALRVVVRGKVGRFVFSRLSFDKVLLSCSGVNRL
jgi:hypothetical protein